MPYETRQEQWRVSLRREDLETGAFELPATGIYVVRGDYVVAASDLESRTYNLEQDPLRVEDEVDYGVAATSSSPYDVDTDFTFPDNSSYDLARFGYSKFFRSGLLRNTCMYFDSSVYQRVKCKALRLFASITGRG